MHVTLIYPPMADPRAPQLALPSLAAFLRGAGVEVDLLDLSIGSLLALLRPANAEAAGRRILDRDGEDGRAWSRLADHLANRLPTALAHLRDAERFFDPGDYAAARDVVCHGLALHSVAAERPLVAGLLPVRYDVQDVDPSLLDDLLAVTADRRANLYADHWEAEVFPALERRRLDLVGITITNRQQILPGLTLARELRKRGHFVVLGGAVYTKFAAELQRSPAFFDAFADAVVVYEGETALLALASELGPGGSRRLDRVPNLLYLDGGRVHATARHVEAVETLPTPDFSGLPLEEYLTPFPVLPILTGKGCYFNRCKFCDIPYINHISQKAYRVRSPQRIVEDVQTLERRFGARHFVITDEALSPKLLVQLADALGPGDRHFTGYARLEPGFTADVCRRIATAGIRKLFFGLESASQAMLDHMDKGVRVSEVPPVLRHCRDAGIHFHVFSIIGFPEENEASARETMQFFVDNADVIDHPGNSFDIHPFGFELRTRYFEDAAKHGVLISPAALKRPFNIGLGKGDWQNTRGLDEERVEALIQNEFYPALRQIYRRSHNCPVHLWPGFEEYAVLYADRYRTRPFLAATSTPEMPRRFRMRWNPAVRIEKADGDGEERVRLLYGPRQRTLFSSLYLLLARPVFRTAAAVAEEAAGDSADPAEQAALGASLREIIDDLIGTGYLQVELEAEEGGLRTV
jgi:anaerobic magnesium-protoporphyrin IX monomethyl ester cyclase